MEEIKQWLEAEDRTAAHGVVLLKKHSKNKNVITAIDKDIAKGEYKKEGVLASLQYQLSKLLKGSVLAVKKITKNTAADQNLKDAETPVNIEGNKSENLLFGESKFVDLSKLPVELQEKYIGIKDGWKAISELHTQLQDEKLADADRAEVLDKLLRTADFINQAWFHIRAFCDATPEAAKEELPEVLNPTGQALIDAYRRLSVARDNISRVKNEIENLKDVKAIQKRQDKIVGWETEIAECKVTLQGIQF